MLLSLNLLKKYLNFPSTIAPEEVKLRLTSATVEVERAYPVKGKAQGVVGLDDFVFEIDNKSLTNRPDLWSHYGAARELAAIFGLKLKLLGLKLDGFRKPEKPDLKISIANKTACPRYLAAKIENIKIAQSPAWLKKELAAVGIRPINNLVDITNYVLIELGQPLHAFDFEKIKSANSKLANPNNKQASKSKNQNQAEIIVRLAKSREKILTLDGVGRDLDKNILVIANRGKPVALAGIMGGEETGVTGQTQSIILESANFNPMVIRRGSQILDLKTESSIRFEKGLHPYLAELGLKRALELIKQLQPQAKIIEISGKDFFVFKPNIIKTSYTFIGKKIGQEFRQQEIDQPLKKLGFGVKRLKNQELEVSVPWWRSTGDISASEDIIEEAARIYGYDNLQGKTERVDLEKAKYQLEFDLESKIKNYLSLACGMTEVFNYPWAEEKILNRLGFKNRLLELAHPPTEETRFLQPSLIPNLIKNIETNLRFFDQFKIFELTRVFQPGQGEFDGQDNLPKQPKMLAGALAGNKEPDLFLLAKGITEQLLEISGQTGFNFSQNKEIEFLESGKSLMVKLKAKPIGYLGQLKIGLCRELGLGNRQIVLFEFDFSQLVGERGFIVPPKYQFLPAYPAITRDLTVVLNQQINWQEILDSLANIDKLVKKIKFLGIYNLPDNKKSVSFRVVYQSEKRTLISEEAEKSEKKIIKQLKDRFKAELK
ncbi:MAG: phenylalanine--tRNA ligase subunit beta [Patescibacteria group bacterium]